jgi:hypothetical protein
LRARQLQQRFGWNLIVRGCGPRFRPKSNCVLWGSGWRSHILLRSCWTVGEGRYTHVPQNWGQNQAPTSAATSRKVWCKEPRRWKRVVARKIRYVTSVMVTDRWSYVAWLFPIIWQRMEVSHPPLCTQFSAFVRTLENHICHLWERAMYLT